MKDLEKQKKTAYSNTGKKSMIWVDKKIDSSGRNMPLLSITSTIDIHSIRIWSELFSASSLSLVPLSATTLSHSKLLSLTVSITLLSGLF